MPTSLVSGNIWKIAVIRTVRSFLLIIPVIVLFFRENGLSLREVFILQSLFSVSAVVLEVPTGYLSDRFGRKNSIITGYLLGVVGHGVYSFSHGFRGFLLAETLLGFGASFISGSDSALLYDSLGELSRLREHKRIEGRNTSLSLFSEGTAGILGGVLAMVSLRLPLYVESIVMCAGIPIAFLLVEPQRERLNAVHTARHEMVRIIRYALHEHAELRWLILFSSVVGASTLTMVWFIQPYLAAAGLPLGYFGAVWAAFMFIGSFFSWHAHSVERSLGRTFSLVSLIAMPALAYLILGTSDALMAGFVIVLFYVTRGIHNPVLADYINQLVDSDIRATILSVKNLIGRSMFSIVGPFVGWASDAYSLQTALLLCGMIFLVSGSATLLGLTRATSH
ncbi:MAG TPA: MFS transporter [Candidatus Fimivivens sp.]|nr:MFS transporter [Candidatus Fimivivens sp.]